MANDKLMLLLTDRESEVLQEALELYLHARPVPFDARFEYRYRTARTVLESLNSGVREIEASQRGDDDEAGAVLKERPRRPVREVTED